MQWDHEIPIENNLGFKVLPVDLIHEFPTSATRRQNVEITTLIMVDGHDFFDAEFACSNHGSDGVMLGTESHAGACINTYASVDVPVFSNESTPDISYREFSNPSGIDNRDCFFNELRVGYHEVVSCLLLFNNVHLQNPRKRYTILPAVGLHGFHNLLHKYTQVYPLLVRLHT